MIIDVHCISYNEEKIIPYFVKHYEKFCRKIYVWDNYSTDATIEMAKSLSNKVEVNSWYADDKMNDFLHIELKQSFRTKSLDADFVIVVDCDEFLEVDLDYLMECKKNKVTIPKVIGIEMFSNSFNFKSSIDSVQHGLIKPNLAKRCIFNPVIHMKWDVGCHPSQRGNQLLATLGGKEDKKANCFMKHYKWVNLDYVIERYRSYGSRLSNENKKYGLGFHYLKSESDIRLEYKNIERDSRLISDIMKSLK